MSEPDYSVTFTAQDADIDELGHVNNAVWVRWVQDVAIGHWNAFALPEHVDAYVWVITRHEIDYRGNLKSGESVVARTWVGEPRGARFDRYVAFTGEDGKVKVESKTIWAIVEKASGRILRVPPEVAAPFLALRRG